MNSIIYQPKAIKQLRKIQAQDSKKIRAKIDNLENMPDCVNVKSLTDHEYSHRLRVGNYRVLFNFDGEIEIVSIEEVKKRDESTY